MVVIEPKKVKCREPCKNKRGLARSFEGEFHDTVKAIAIAPHTIRRDDDDFIRHTTIFSTWFCKKIPVKLSGERWDSRNLAAHVLPGPVFTCASFHSGGPEKKAQSNLCCCGGHHALSSTDGKGTFPAKKFKAQAKSQREGEGRRNKCAWKRFSVLNCRSQDQI